MERKKKKNNFSIISMAYIFLIILFIGTLFFLFLSRYLKNRKLYQTNQRTNSFQNKGRITDKADSEMIEQG